MQELITRYRNSWDAEEVRNLLQNGVQVDCDVWNGSTKLMLACFKGDKKMAEVLVEHGADVNHVDNHGNGILFYALLGNNRPIHDLLIEKGARQQSVLNAEQIAAVVIIKQLFDKK